MTTPPPEPLDRLAVEFPFVWESGWAFLVNVYDAAREQGVPPEEALDLARIAAELAAHIARQEALVHYARGVERIRGPRRPALELLTASDPASAPELP